jgi:hypothetical protein
MLKKKKMYEVWKIVTKILKETATFWSDVEGKKFFQNTGTYL